MDRDGQEDLQREAIPGSSKKIAGTKKGEKVDAQEPLAGVGM